MDARYWMNPSNAPPSPPGHHGATRGCRTPPVAASCPRARPRPQQGARLPFPSLRVVLGKQPRAQQQVLVLMPPLQIVPQAADCWQCRSFCGSRTTPLGAVATDSSTLMPPGPPWGSSERTLGPCETAAAPPMLLCASASSRSPSSKAPGRMAWGSLSRSANVNEDVEEEAAPASRPRGSPQPSFVVLVRGLFLASVLVCWMVCPP